MRATESGIFALPGDDGRTHTMWLDQGQSIDLPLPVRTLPKGSQQGSLNGSAQAGSRVARAAH